MMNTVDKGQSGCCAAAFRDAPARGGSANPGVREGLYRAVDSELSCGDRLGMLRMRLGSAVLMRLGLYLGLRASPRFGSGRDGNPINGGQPHNISRRGGV
jgi:hypothetical protein